MPTSTLGLFSTSLYETLRGALISCSCRRSTFKIISIYFIPEIFLDKSISESPGSHHKSNYQTSWHMFAHQMENTPRPSHRRNDILQAASIQHPQCGIELLSWQVLPQNCHQHWNIRNILRKHSFRFLTKLSLYINDLDMIILVSQSVLTIWMNKSNF